MSLLTEYCCNGCSCTFDRKIMAVLLLTQLAAVVFVAVIALVKGRD